MSRRQVFRRTQDELRERLFSSTPTGLAVWDLEFRFVAVNPTMAAINGLPIDEHLGRRVEEVIPDLPEVPAAFRRVLETRRAVTADVVGRTPAHPNEDRYWLTTYYPLEDDEGELIGIGASVIDVTLRRRAETALRRSRDEHRFLANASRLLASSLDLHATLESVADLAVPDVADWCSVDLLDEQGFARNVALAHADPSQLALGRSLVPFASDRTESPAPVLRVIETGRHELHAEAGEALLREAARDDRELEGWRALGIRSVLIVPMIARGRTIGAISFLTAGSGRRIVEDDVPFAERLAAHCAIAVDNARLYSAQAEAARQLQENLLPPMLPDVPGFQLAARYRAAAEGIEVGGDFYDVFPAGPDSWLLAIGDVQGKGPRAAAVTGLARYSIRAAATRGADSRGVLGTLNTALLREERGRRFLTLVYATLDLRSPEPRVTVANAGHPRPLVVRADGAVEPLGNHGMLLGVVEDVRVEDSPLDLNPGDALVLYTDGVIEAPHGDGILGEEGLIDVLRDCAGASADALAESVLSGALSEGGSARDDVAVLVLRRAAA
jgi:PAS domain S-box-containing protein